MKQMEAISLNPIKLLKNLLKLLNMISPIVIYDIYFNLLNNCLIL